jgi:hypothetical protein
MQPTLSNSPATSGNTGNDITHTLPQNNMYIISYHETTNANGWQCSGCNAKLTAVMNPRMQIHPVILSWLADKWKIEIGSNQESIDCYTEMKVKDSSTYHAHPNYCNEGPWQDWANISFGRDEHGLLQMVSSRILLFYNHHFSNDNGGQKSKIQALVQICKYQVGLVQLMAVINEGWIITR